jgi:hypothetical protein
VVIKLRRLIKLEQTSYACPSQWEGVLETGQHIYIRYRYSSLGFGIGKNIEDAINNSKHIMNYGEGADGFLTEGKMLELLNLEIKED